MFFFLIYNRPSIILVLVFYDKVVQTSNVASTTAAPMSGYGSRRCSGGSSNAVAVFGK